jgi:hypothetical protein
MPLNAPNLDSRRFADLVAEARARIPRYAPEWTNLNDSDPGMTLVKLNAWLTETVLYELNRVPDLNYVKFLELLHVKPIPAQAARTELTFTLKKLSAATDPLRVLVPKGARVAVDDPDLEEEVLFETDRTLEAINAAIGAVIVPNPDGAHKLELITEYDGDKAETTWLHAARPLSAAGDLAWIGLVLRPHITGDLDDYSQDVFPAGDLDIHVQPAEPGETDAAGALLTETPGWRQCLFPWEVAEQAEGVGWQVYFGANPAADFYTAPGPGDAWADLRVAGDETAGLTRRGHLRLTIPERVATAAMDALPRAFWRDLGLNKPPTDADEFLADLTDDALTLFDALCDGEGEQLLETMGLDLSAAPGLLGCDSSGAALAAALRTMLDGGATLDPTAVSPEEWIALDAGYDAPETPRHKGVSRPMVWLRMRLRDASAPPALLRRLRLNTAPATAAATRLDERLGASDGRPAQRFTLEKTPVLIAPETQAPDLELEVADEQGAEIWRRVDDFFRAGPDSAVYTLDPETGTIGFGDGRRGRIPVAGARVRAVRYRWGGGAVGNAGAGSVTKLKGALRHVDVVTNPVPAENGADAEAMETVLLRAPHDLRARDRAVSAEDFAHLAKQTPGVAVHKAYALARRRYDPEAEEPFVEQDGAVTVVALPANDEPKPTPSAAQLAAICAHLEPRRLVTTELHVAGPRYVDVTELTARLTVGAEADLQAVEQAARAALLGWLHPLTGGAAGDGWPFGAPIAHGDLYALLLDLEGVRRVERLSLTLDLPFWPPAGTPPDVTPLPEGRLPHLAPTALDVRARHDQRS